MSEGHFIHRVARDQTRDLANSRLRVNSPQGRASTSAERLDGQTLRRIDAHGKHLFYRFERLDTPHVHLGLYGEYRRFRPPPTAPKDTVRIRVASTAWAIDLTGPSACALVDPQEGADIRARLGPDPILTDADPEVVRERLRRRSRRREAVHVYGRETCGRCGASVERFDLGARWAYRCPSCQPTYDVAR